MYILDGYVSELTVRHRSIDVGRLCVGIYQGAQMALFRTYLGETSATVISTLPHEKRKKSTIKHNNFLIAFSVGTTFLAVDPG